MDNVLPAALSADTSHVARDLMFNKPVVEMPATGQLIATVVFGLLALLTLVYAFRVAKRTGHSYPLWVFLGSLASLPFETFDLTLGHCLYPQAGQWVALEILGVKLPWFLVFIYPVYIAGIVIFIYEHMINGTMTRSLWWKTAITCIGMAALFEPPALYLGLWLYYGENQTLRFLGLPFWWAFANSVSMLCIGLFSYQLWSGLWKKQKTWLLLVTMPILLFGSHTAMSWPVYLALNSTSDTLITNAGGLATAALSLFVVWFTADLIKPAQRSA